MTKRSKETKPDNAGEDDPKAIRRNLAVMAAATGAPVPGDGRDVPPVNIDQPLSVVARTCGQVMHSAPLFLFAGSLCTVSDGGEKELMTAERFCSWAEDWLCFTASTKEGPAPKSIGKDLAGKIMAADQFRVNLRELKAVHHVRLPVWRGEGDKRSIELAPVGFDMATGILTLDAIPYKHDMTKNAALRVLNKALVEFPWESEGQEEVHKRRSFAAMIAAMVGAFCVPLFPDGTAKLLIVFNGNQPGSGKSLLARMVVAPAHGMPGENTIPKDENEFRKVLTSAAFGREPFLLLDDVSSLGSHALNSFITASQHKDRVMNSQTSRSVAKVTQCLATGNGLTITPDLERRALIVDLFEAREALSRSFKYEITSEWLAKDETRAAFLAALWALVRDWNEAGQPMQSKCRRPSFETWSAAVGSITMHAGFSNPFAKRESQFGGDEAGRALLEVLAVVAGAFDDGDEPKPNAADILEAAEQENKLDVILPFAKDHRKALGHKLGKLRGRQFRDTRGRLYEFGRRDVASGAVYPIRYLSAPGVNGEA